MAPEKRANFFPALSKILDFNSPFTLILPPISTFIHFRRIWCEFDSVAPQNNSISTTMHSRRQCNIIVATYALLHSSGNAHQVLPEPRFELVLFLFQSYIWYILFVVIFCVLDPGQEPSDDEMFDLAH